MDIDRSLMMQPGSTGGFGIYQRDGSAQDARGVKRVDCHAGFPHSYWRSRLESPDWISGQGIIPPALVISY